MERYFRNYRENNSNIRKNTTSNKSSSVRESWKYECSNIYGGVDKISSTFLGGLSWPPRSYTCSFCKREFRSAQALGGHMNVHRRDRARLRESTPWDHAPSPDPELNSKPNPNLIPNLNNLPTPVADDTIFSFRDRVPQSTYSFPSLLSPLSHFPPLPSLVSSDHIDDSCHAQPKPRKAMKALFRTAGGMDGHEGEEKGAASRRTRDVVRLELEIGLHGDDLDDDLDLELRLGWSPSSVLGFL